VVEGGGGFPMAGARVGSWGAGRRTRRCRCSGRRRQRGTTGTGRRSRSSRRPASSRPSAPRPARSPNHNPLTVGRDPAHGARGDGAGFAPAVHTAELVPPEAVLRRHPAHRPDRSDGPPRGLWCCGDGARPCNRFHAKSLSGRTSLFYFSSCNGKLDPFVLVNRSVVMLLDIFRLQWQPKDHREENTRPTAFEGYACSFFPGALSSSSR